MSSKKPETVNEAPAATGAVSRRPRARGLYPVDPLASALRVAAAIRDHNAGKPFRRITLAEAMDTTPSSSVFRLLITSSNRYGLTDGNYASSEISLTERGRDAVGDDPDRRRAAHIQAALQPDAFGRFLTFYDESRLPSDAVAKKKLQEFGVPEGNVDECLGLIISNAQFLSIIKEMKGGSNYVMLEGASAPPSLDSSEESESSDAATTAKPDASQDSDFQPTPPAQEMERSDLVENVFVSHSKNKGILDEIKTMLTFGKFHYEIAEERETTAMPVPVKVLESMRRCQSAIINVSADEQERRSDGTYGINQNVLIEIGSAFVLYDQKVVLLVDKRIQLPSNLQGLYRCEYEGDELSWKAGMALQKALSTFREPIVAAGRTKK